MNTPNAVITRLYFLRNQFGKEAAIEKRDLLTSLKLKSIKSKNNLQVCNALLHFIIAYPDNKAIYTLANLLLKQLQEIIEANDQLQYRLYNTGITATAVCASFNFELVSWLRKTRPGDIRFHSFSANDAQIQSILSVVMPKAESEILQDGNAEWKSWFKKLKNKEEDLLDQLIAVFCSSPIRPEVKDELWNAIGVHVEINFKTHCCLPDTWLLPYYHQVNNRKENSAPANQWCTGKKTGPSSQNPVQIKLTEAEAEQIIDCGRMILVRHLREIDPISFTSAKWVTYYQLDRGFSIALMGMVPARRHPIDCYMGYLVFKNGLPVAYAGSWLLFNSGRIGLNIFPGYRGGESKYIFDQVLQLHARVYRLNRFTVDPYQIGKDNSDGIHSGAFWLYYHAGFRPLQKLQLALAGTEAIKIKTNKNYRSPQSVLKILANSRLELVFKKGAVGFDATDLSRVYAAILINKYKGNRLVAEKGADKKLATLLQIKNYQAEGINFILKNWASLLLANEKELRRNSSLRKLLKKLFNLKANGSEEAYVTALQQSAGFKNFIEGVIKNAV